MFVSCCHTKSLRCKKQKQQKWKSQKSNTHKHGMAHISHMTACEITIYYTDDFNYIVKLTTLHTTNTTLYNAIQCCSIYHFNFVTSNGNFIGYVYFCCCCCVSSITVHIAHMKYDFLVHDHFCLWSQKIERDREREEKI